MQPLQPIPGGNTPGDRGRYSKGATKKQEDGIAVCTSRNLTSTMSGATWRIDATLHAPQEENAISLAATKARARTLVEIEWSLLEGCLRGPRSL